MTVHKFSMAEIGILYLVDTVASLIFGPITGQLADKYGRRKFCNIYNWSIILNLLLRMQGSRLMAYLAQIVRGLGARLICTTFEAWAEYESDKEFKGYHTEAERFRKKLFKTANILDASISIITSIVFTFIYSYFGIYAPFWISIGLSFLANVVVKLLWDENKPLAEKNKGTSQQIRGALNELKKVLHAWYLQ